MTSGMPSTCTNAATAARNRLLIGSINADGEGLPPVLPKEVHHPAFRLQPGDVEVEVHPIDALQLPGDMVGDDVRNGPW